MNFLKHFLALSTQLPLFAFFWLPSQAIAHQGASHGHLADVSPILRRGNTEAHRKEFKRQKEAYDRRKLEWEAARAEYLRDPEAYLRKVGGSGGRPGTHGSRAPVVKHTGGGDCAVCLDELGAEGGRVREVGPCHHKLHDTCATRWEMTPIAGGTKRPTCPHCRGRMWFDGATAKHEKALGLRETWPPYIPRQGGARSSQPGPTVPEFARPVEEATGDEQTQALRALRARVRPHEGKGQGAEGEPSRHGEEGHGGLPHHAVEEARRRLENVKIPEAPHGSFGPHPLKARAVPASLRRREARLARNRGSA